jgi:hypothetical protein
MHRHFRVIAQEEKSPAILFPYPGVGPPGACIAPLVEMEFRSLTDQRLIGTHPLTPLVAELAPATTPTSPRSGNIPAVRGPPPVATCWNESAYPLLAVPSRIRPAEAGTTNESRHRPVVALASNPERQSIWEKSRLV